VRERVEALARRWWRGDLGTAGEGLSLLTAPLEWAYAAEVRRRARGFSKGGGARVEGLRVVSVGNLVVGGTGKTPVAAWMIRVLADAGARPALLSRGYGDDELRLHRRWNPGAVVEANADRLAAARRAHHRGAEVAVLDDGFQHRRLARDVDVVLLAAEDPFPGRMLPRGPYREPADALERADAVIVTRRTAPSGAASALGETIARRYAPAAVASLALLQGSWLTLEGRPAKPPEGAILAVAGIARPEAFRSQVADATGTDPGFVAFPDHHAYTAAEAGVLRRRAGTRTLVVTEKDAVKLEQYANELGSVRVLGMRLAWESGETEVRNLVAALAPRGA
jgi:tetraacyldisaccharide 4'-kinase